MPVYEKHIITKTVDGQTIHVYPETVAEIVRDALRNQSVEESLTELFERNEVYIANIDCTDIDNITCDVEEYTHIGEAIDDDTTVVGKMHFGEGSNFFIPLSVYTNNIDGHTAVFTSTLSGSNVEFIIYQNDTNVDFNIIDLTSVWGNITGDIADQTDLTNALNSKQDALTAGTGITIDENNVISCNLQLEHKSYYDTSIYTLYEGIAPNGSTTSQAVWTITTIVSNAIGTIVSTSSATNQTWNYN